jgi:hypothetical protein
VLFLLVLVLQQACIYKRFVPHIAFTSFYVASSGESDLPSNPYLSASPVRCGFCLLDGRPSLPHQSSIIHLPRETSAFNLSEFHYNEAITRTYLHCILSFARLLGLAPPSIREHTYYDIYIDFILSLVRRDTRFDQ